MQPIKLEKLVTPKFKYIEWKLHNVCNYDCSFCGEEHKDGSNRWKDLDTYKMYVDKLVDAAKGKPLWIQFTGGEPTLYPKLIDLFKYIKSKGAYTGIVTNATRTLRWWEELKESKSLDHLYVTFHTEQQASREHVSKILNLFHNEPTKTVCLVTHVIKTVEEAFDAVDYFVENTGALIYSKAMTIVAYDIYKLYTPDQLSKLRKQSLYYGSNYEDKCKTELTTDMQLNSQLKFTYADGSIEEIESAQQIMKDRRNLFKDWKCNIGVDNARIEYSKVYRGVCGAGTMIADLDTDVFNFEKDPISCPYYECHCAINLGTYKVAP
jgi:MoaA/NifB/PqqE/SkfB family radical SAM enzyme